jgi:pyridoxal 5'-phosphate synthase pdxS subunit
MLRTKGEAGSGNIVEAVRHMRAIQTELKRISVLDEEEIVSYAKKIGASAEIVSYVKIHGKLPVPNFAAGGVATPADASLMMQLGAESVFVGSGIFKSSDPARRAKAIVRVTTHYMDFNIVAQESEDLKEAMKGLEISDIPEEQLLQTRGW